MTHQIPTQLSSQKWFNEFAFDGKTLVKLTDTYWRQFVFFEPIAMGEQVRFYIKIVKSRQRNVMIGIIDYNKQKQKASSYNSQNAICYGVHGGRKYPEGEKQGNGVTVGQTVEVRVDRRNKKISWLVNGKQRACSTKEMLGDERRDFFPYVQMFEDGDEIQIWIKNGRSRHRNLEIKLIVVVICVVLMVANCLFSSSI